MSTPRRAKLSPAEIAKREARAALIAEQAAARMEITAEEMAPRAQRVAVTAADGTVLRDALAERDDKRGGFVRSNSIWQMMRQGSITGDQYAAARRYALDYEVGALGANPARIGEFVDGKSGVDVSQSRLDAMRRYREASDAMGAHRQVVQWLAIHDAPDNRWTLTKAAQALGVTHARASASFKSGLDVLALHYWPHKAERTAPERAVVDGRVRDVPQERLGRAAA